MGWFPVGPAFVFAPRNDGYLRLSRRNERGRQTVVLDVAVDPTFDPAVAGAMATVYIVEAAGYGNSAWRSDDDGASWTPIGDALQQQRQSRFIDPTCVAINPNNPNVVYLGTASRGGFVSNNRGAPGSWSAGTGANAAFRRIVVDARTSATPATTVLYAATDRGVLRSADGGATWSAAALVAGDAHGLAAFFNPVTNAAEVYATIWGAGAPGLGLYYTQNPAAAANWSNLNDLANGLPLRASGSFDAVLVDVCARNPSRAYACFMRGGTFAGVFTTAAAPAAWTRTPGTPLGSFQQWSLAFAVTPNSPGDGASDILALGCVAIHRSIDAGTTWQADQVPLFVDHHALAFAPVRPAAGIVPVTYAGCDGGVGKSTRFADRTVAIDAPGSDFNAGATPPSDLHDWQNCNRGRQSVDPNGYASPRGYPALNYVASWDSGLKGGAGATWRGLTPGDCTWIAAAAGPRGMAIWSGIFLRNELKRWIDIGDYRPAFEEPALNGVFPSPTSPPVVESSGSCVVGLAAAALRVVARVGDQGDAVQISQDFSPLGTVVGLAIDPSNVNVLYCLSRNGNQPARLWSTTSASTASAATMWTELATGKPAAQSVAALTVGLDGVVHIGMGFLAGQPALYSIVGGAWVPQASTGAPASGSVNRIVADPSRANVLYALDTASVYRLTLTAGTWSWEAFALTGLPFQLLLELDAVLVTDQPLATSKVVLRVATATRGIFEADADPTAQDPATALYVRRHFLDTGWLAAAADGIPDPYRPGKTVAHYQCADIKFDLPQPGNVYQTDPEWDQSGPLDPVLFEEIKEDPAGVLFRPTTNVQVHVQAHNRSLTPANGVSVWTLYANVAAGLPALDRTTSGATFSFWNQFAAGGAIIPALPSDSVWKAVGPPRVVSGLDASHPRVASWDWTVPLRRKRDPCSNFCFATFLHSALSPIGESTRVDVDEITTTNPQVGLKNVARCPPLHKKPPHRPRPHRPVRPHAGARRARHPAAYVEFHNASAKARQIDLVIDARELPAGVGLTFQLTEHKMARPPRQAITGASAAGGAKRKRSAAAAAGRVRDTVLDIVPPRGETRAVEGLPLAAFGPAIYRADRRGYVEVRGLELPAWGRGALFLTFRQTGALESGATFYVDVLQRRRGSAGPALAGGTRCAIRVGGARARAVEGDAPLEDEGPRIPLPKE